MTRSWPAEIASVHNPLIVEIRRCLSKGILTDDGLLVIESEHLLAEAQRSRAEVVVVLAEDGPLRARNQIHATAAVLKAAASTETSPGVIALIRLPQATPAKGRAPLVVVLDRIQDPGNAGTIVRSAEAFGATEVTFLPGSASPFNAKTLRAAAGSLFRMPLSRAVPARVTLYAAHTRDGQPIGEVDFRRPSAIVVGSEAHGVSADLLRQSTPVWIPTAGVESLNAAVAASILLYEASRQRGTV